MIQREVWEDDEPPTATWTDDLMEATACFSNCTAEKSDAELVEFSGAAKQACPGTCTGERYSPLPGQWHTCGEPCDYPGGHHGACDCGDMCHRGVQHCETVPEMAACRR